MAELEEELFPTEEVYSSYIDPDGSRRAYNMNIQILNRQKRIAQINEQIT
jgi:hypothetical protein